MIKLSVVVITFNEESNIGRCLDSVRDIADEILLVDSFSTDQTLEIARQYHARIIQHPWTDFCAQRKFAAQQARYDHVLALDADEYLSDQLRDAVGDLKKNWKDDCYKFKRLNRIGDTWVRHTSWYPDRKLRLFDRRKVTFSGIGGHDKVDPVKGATTGFIDADLLHNALFNLHHRAIKGNNTSTEVAEHYYHQGRKGSWLRVLFKPAFRFLIEYFVRLGFLSGFYGYALSVTAAQYVFLREIKLLEMHRLGKSYSRNDWKK